MSSLYVPYRDNHIEMSLFDIVRSCFKENTVLLLLLYLLKIQPLKKKNLSTSKIKNFFQNFFIQNILIFWENNWS
jgi:hypothetical protein